MGKVIAGERRCGSQDHEKFRGHAVSPLQDIQISTEGCHPRTGIPPGVSGGHTARDAKDNVDPRKMSKTFACVCTLGVHCT